MRRSIAVFIAATAATATIAADPLPAIAPERAGFSSEGLARIERFFAREIAADHVPGAIVAIARDGRLVHYKAYGFLDKAANRPMPLDAVFSLASMTKIMVTVGGLTLNEEGRLPLKSRVDEYIPAVGQMKVGSVSATGGPTLPPFAPPLRIAWICEPRSIGWFDPGSCGCPASPRSSSWAATARSTRC